MTVALMQPYLFPYIGYFQLIAAADLFVIYDNVQYSKGGWINRNRILRDGSDAMITLPVHRDSLHLHINQRKVAEPFGAECESFLRKVEMAYRRAPMYRAAMPVLEEAMTTDDPNLAAFLTRTLKTVCRYLGIETPFRYASEVEDGPSQLRGEERVIDINRRLGSTRYVNSIGGMELYSTATFAASGIELRFVRSQPIEYRQFGNPFVPHLSIIDVLMFNEPEVIREFLTRFELITSPESSLV
jgi:hypothetical protein